MCPPVSCECGDRSNKGHSMRSAVEGLEDVLGGVGLVFAPALEPVPLPPEETGAAADGVGAVVRHQLARCDQLPAVLVDHFDLDACEPATRRGEPDPAPDRHAVPISPAPEPVPRRQLVAGPAAHARPPGVNEPTLAPSAGGG